MIIVTYTVQLGQFFKINIIINPRDQKLGNEQLDFVYASSGWNMYIISDTLVQSHCERKGFPLNKKIANALNSFSNFISPRDLH